MSATFTNYTGDGLTTNMIQVNIALPDTNGGSVLFAGRIQPAGGASISITGSTVFPPAPATGSIYLLVEANLSTGGLTLLQSTTSMPVLDTNNILVFSDILTSSSTDIAQDPNEVTPDNY